MRKVLVITYYWPPAGGPGVQRWLKFVKYLRDFGVEPVVYIPENPNYPIIDDTFEDEIPEDITIYKHRIFEPYRIASIFSKKKTKRISSGIIQTKNQSILEKIMLWVRGNFFIPDARKYWVRPSVKFLYDVLEKDQIDTVITTGPPHSVHLIGYHLKEFKKIKWIADFRDPWTSIGYHKKLKLTSMAQNRHKELEQLVLTKANKIVVTSETTRKEFQAITRQPIEVITNGFDSIVTRKVVLDEKFTISHIGSMLTGRNPKNLWKVIAELIAENSAFKESVRLQFLGVLSDDVLQTLKKSGLENYVDVLGYVSHEEAIQHQQKSQVLLLVEIDSEETKGIIPGKLFEYMAAERPVLGVGPIGWEVAHMVAFTKTGAIFEYSAHFQLKNVLLNWFEQYQTKQLRVSSVSTNQYSRRELTRKLAEYI
ncbi:glycosyltransferase family 4 protein [Maribacter algarum]|uniref:Glycosyltransferase family 4 protein n=1 Tax=Maribacter algarum (ex Zhang et al. 2020) TaxID=2578118 RepID=A0A5S3PQQ3_9FLAO|nr:glycosyltransferase family 4 protein [Maribacter algarum]TMM57024.1 glycosyltransferase family 4 protein [Maribacter algarum]